MRNHVIYNLYKSNLYKILLIISELQGILKFMLQVAINFITALSQYFFDFFQIGIQNSDFVYSVLL